MKKLMAMLLAGVMAMSLAACGSSGSSAVDTTAAAQDTTAAADATTAAGDETTAAAGDETTAAAAESGAAAVATVIEGKLTVGTEAGFAPYEYLAGDEVVGVDMDIAKAIADKMGLELNIVNEDFDAALNDLAEGKVDIVAAGVSISPERQEKMDFSDSYVGSNEVIVVNAASPAIEASTGEALSGKTVGVQQGNIADLWVSDEANTKPGDIRRYTKFAQAAEDLKNAKIDCIVMDEQPALQLVAESDGALAVMEGDYLFNDEYAIAIQKGNTAMTEAVNAVIAELKTADASGVTPIDQFLENHSNAQ